MRRFKTLMFQKNKGPSGFRKIADPQKKNTPKLICPFLSVSENRCQNCRAYFQTTPWWLKKSVQVHFVHDFFWGWYKNDPTIKGKTSKKHLQTPTQVKKWKKLQKKAPAACSICFFEKVQGSVLTRLRPGGASVETEVVLSTNCTPMIPQGENMDALRLVEVKDWLKILWFPTYDDLKWVTWMGGLCQWGIHFET